MNDRRLDEAALRIAQTIQGVIMDVERESRYEAMQRERDIVDRAYADLRREMAKSPGENFPHCDEWVLHSRGTCEYCDSHPKWQMARLRLRILFTDDEQPSDAWDGKARPCPATLFRPAEKIHRWYGNVATTMRTARGEETIYTGPTPIA